MKYRLDTTLTSREAGMITRAVGIRQAALDYESHFGDVGHKKADGFVGNEGTWMTVSMEGFYASADNGLFLKLLSIEM